MLPLNGVRVLAVEQYGTGPFGTMFLADQGAEVIKIEIRNDGGDMSRAMGPYFFAPGDSEFYHSFNRNKKSLTLERFAGAVPAAPIHDLAQALENPFVTQHGRLQTLPHPVKGSYRMVAPPVQCAREEAPAPVPAFHTTRLLFKGRDGRLLRRKKSIRPTRTALGYARRVATLPGAAERWLCSAPRCARRGGECAG